MDDIFDEPPYSIPKRLLTIVGVWPLQPRRQRRTRIAVVMFSFLGMFLPLVTEFVKDLRHHLFALALECLPPIMTALVVLVKYLNGVLQVEKLKDVCTMIKTDSERLKGLPEYDVLYSNAMDGRKYCVFFVVALHGLLVIYLILPTALIINNVITKNETEEKYFMYRGTYVFFDAQNYYFIGTFHCYLASVLIILFVCPLDTMYVTFTQHACAVFAVVGYRLKTVHILNEDALRKEFDKSKCDILLLDKQQRMYEKIILCIKEHKRALECVAIVQAAFSRGLFFQIGLNILCLSTTGVQAVMQKSSGNPTDVIRLITWMMGQHIHLFFLYLPGQRLLDFSNKVYYDMLECMWAQCFTKSRVIYQIMLMRTLIPVQLTALKVVTLNIEAFLSVTQVAVSYFTVLSSTI